MTLSTLWVLTEPSERLVHDHVTRTAEPGAHLWRQRRRPSPGATVVTRGRGRRIRRDDALRRGRPRRERFPMCPSPQRCRS